MSIMSRASVIEAPTALGHSQRSDPCSDLFILLQNSN